MEEKNWLCGWSGIRFYSRFFRLPAGQTTTKKIKIVSSGKRSFWFDQRWNLIFPAHPDDYELQPEQEYGLQPARSIENIIEQASNLDDIHEILDSISDAPFIMASIYASTIFDPHEHQLLTLRNAYIDSLQAQARKPLRQHTAVYAFPALEPVQRDYISEFLDLLRSQIRTEQELVDLNQIDIDYDDYPLSTNSFIDRHVQVLVIDMSSEQWYLIVGYDSFESDDTTLPMEIEILTTIAVENSSSELEENDDEKETVSYDLVLTLV